MSWNRLAGIADLDPSLQPPPITYGATDDVISTTTTAARTRNAAELSAKIKAAGGALVVSANDSNYIVAANNGLRFSVTRLANGQYRITESMNYLLLLAVAAAVGIVILSRR